MKECILNVNYFVPSQPLPPIRQDSEEDFSPSASISDNGTVSSIDSSVVSFDMFCSIYYMLIVLYILSECCNLIIFDSPSVTNLQLTSYNI